MESLLGFEKTTTAIEKKSCGYKLVPWLSWDEWDSVRKSLFSPSPHSVASALSRISAWRSRGCLPVVIEVTASIIEIQQKDPFFRADLMNDDSHLEQMLAMLYCMAIMRLVNGVVEKMRKKSEVSIAEAADAIGIPRMLIDIRHECSHRDLPSLRLVRLGSIKAIDWLKSYYWEPQKKVIPFQRDGTAHLRKEIKSKLSELAICLKVKQSPRLRSLLIKEKRVKHWEWLCGRNKFFSLMAGQLHYPKSGGYKKHTTKILKNLVKLYSSFSSEVVSVLLEYMLKASGSFDLGELPENSQVDPSVDNLQTLFDDWKLVITKFSNKEPKLLLTLLKAVLDMIEAREAMDNEIGGEHLTQLEYMAENWQIKHLSSLFAWLVRNLMGLKPFSHKGLATAVEDSSADLLVPRATLMELLRKCLLVSAPGNDQLMGSALLLAQMTGNSSFIGKLNKLCSLGLPNFDINEENPCLMNSENLLIQQENFIRQAAEKLELVKFHWMERKIVKTTTDGDVGDNNRWVAAKSWNPCPIGMLPCALGSSGCLPVLDCDGDHRKVLESSERKKPSELNRCSGKREASCDIEVLDDSSVKKMRETIDGCESDGKDVVLFEGVKGRLMIDGDWKKVGKEDLLAIKSAIRIFV